MIKPLRKQIREIERKQCRLQKKYIELDRIRRQLESKESLLRDRERVTALVGQHVKVIGRFSDRYCHLQNQQPTLSAVKRTYCLVRYSDGFELDVPIS